MMREQLSGFIHDEQWCAWWKYHLDKCIANEDGSITVPAGYAQALLRQINTPYADLSEAEKESDRAEADRILALLGRNEQHLRAAQRNQSIERAVAKRGKR